MLQNPLILAEESEWELFSPQHFRTRRMESLNHRFPYPFIHFNLWSPYPFIIIPEAWKRYLFWTWSENRANGIGGQGGGIRNVVLMTLLTLLKRNNKFDYNWEKIRVQISESLLKLSSCFFKGFTACLLRSVNQVKNCYGKTYLV